jgi:hypothetical protein
MLQAFNGGDSAATGRKERVGIACAVYLAVSVVGSKGVKVPVDL